MSAHSTTLIGPLVALASYERLGSEAGALIRRQILLSPNAFSHSPQRNDFALGWVRSYPPNRLLPLNALSHW
jgi:hypothetical protein